MKHSLKLAHQFRSSQLGGKYFRPVSIENCVKYFGSLNTSLYKEINKNSPCFLDIHGQRLKQVEYLEFCHIFKIMNVQRKLPDCLITALTPACELPGSYKLCKIIADQKFAFSMNDEAAKVVFHSVLEQI